MPLPTPPVRHKPRSGPESAFAWLLALCLDIACAHPREPIPDFSAKDPASRDRFEECKAGTSSQTSYFPSGHFHEAGILDPDMEAPPEKSARESAIAACRYSVCLAAMDEPVLAVTPDVEAFRFLWIRSFRNPVAVRVERRGGHATLTLKEAQYAYREQAGGHPGRIVANRTRHLSAHEWNTLMHLIQEARFWDPLPRGRSDGLLTVSADGSDWLLEGTTHGRYQVRALWSPTERTPTGPSFRAACAYLLDLSGRPTAPEERR